MVKKSMHKEEFIRKVAARLNGATKEQIRVILLATQQVIEEAIYNQERVKVFDFLYVSGFETKPRKRRDPYHGKPIVIEPHLKPKAEFTVAFRNELRGIKEKKRTV